MQKYRAIGLSLPKEFMQLIDAERGDISRSKYLLRMLERARQSGFNIKQTPRIE
jgi:hypothetical protein